MKRIFTFLFVMIVLHAFPQVQPQFDLAGKIKADGYLTTPAMVYPSAGDLNGDGRPDIVLGTFYDQRYQSDFSLIFLFDQHTGNFVYYDTLRDENGNVLLGFAPALGDINADDTIDLLLRSGKLNEAYTFRYKQVSLNRFKLVDTVRATSGDFLELYGFYTLYRGNKDTLLDIYDPSVLGKDIRFWANSGDTGFTNPYYLRDTGGLSFHRPGSDVKVNYLSFWETSKNSYLYVSFDDGLIYSYLKVDSMTYNYKGAVCDTGGNVIKAENPQALVDTFIDRDVFEMLLFQNYTAPERYKVTDTGLVKEGYVTASDYYLQTFYFPSIYFHDFNGDGYEDAFMSDVFGHILVSLRRGSDVYFLLPDSLKVDGKPIEFGQYIAFAIDDIDGDGHLDLFVRDGYPTADVLHFKQVNGQEFMFVDTLIKQVDRPTFAIGDFNNNGQKELAVCYGNTGQVVFYNYVNGQLDSAFATEPYGNYPQIAAGDIDGDHDLDLILLYGVDYPNDNLWFLLNDGSGNFSQANDYGSYYVGTVNSGIGMTDLDNDGKDDLVLTQNPGYVNYYLNKTSSTSLVQDANLSLTLYPNPVEDVLYIGDTGMEAVQYEITDLQGRTISRGRLGAGQTSINVSSLRPGIYILGVHSRTATREAKFVKM